MLQCVYFIGTEVFFGVLFDRQIYFAHMEWGDESNKRWFKIIQPTIYLIKFTTLPVFQIFQSSPK